MVMGMPSAVMDLPTPRDISMVFVKQYYTLLNEAPDHVHRWVADGAGCLSQDRTASPVTALRALDRQR